MKIRAEPATEVSMDDMKDRMLRIYAKLMLAGFRIGCHQRADRSFFWKDYQFPVCARCTGVIVGYIITLPLYFIWDASIMLCIAFAAIMFVDWLIQHLRILESTNIRRLVTGVMGGYSIFTLQILAVKQIVQWVTT